MLTPESISQRVLILTELSDSMGHNRTTMFPIRISTKIGLFITVLILLGVASCAQPEVRSVKHIYFFTNIPLSLDGYIQEFEQTYPNIRVHVFYDLPDREWPRHYDAALLSIQPQDTLLLQDLTPFADADPAFRPEDFLPGTLAAGRAHDRWVVLPLGMDFHVLLYDTQQLAEAGVPQPTAEWTWADLKEAIVQIDRAKARSRSGRAASFTLRYITLANWLLTQIQPYRQVGERYEPRLNDPEVLAALRGHRDLLSYLGLHVEELNASLPMWDPVTPLSQGHVAMAVVRYSQLSFMASVLQANPYIAYAPLPQPVWVGVDGPGDVRLGPVLAMSRGSQVQPEVWRWFVFFSERFLPVNKVPTRRALLSRMKRPPSLTPAQQEALLTAVTQGLRRWAQDPHAAVRHILGRYLVQLLVQLAAEEVDVDAVQQQAAAAVASWYNRPKDPEPFTVMPPIPPEELARKKRLRVMQEGLASPEARSYVQAFERTHPEWWVSFWPGAAEADAVAFDVDPGVPLAATGAFLTPLMTVEHIGEVAPHLREEDFWPQALSLPSWQGRLPGLPVALSPVLLFYAPNVFIQLELPPPDASWSVHDVWNVAAVIHEKASHLIPYAPQDGYELAFVLEQQGISLFSDALVPQFTAAPVLRALEQLRTWVGPGPLLRGTRPAALMFAFRYAPAGYVPVALMPRPGTRWPVRVFLVGVNRRSPHPRIAWEWAVFAVEHPELVAQGMPALRRLAQDEATRARLGEPRYTAAMTTLQRVPPTPLTDADVLKSLALWWFDQALRAVGPEADLAQVLAPAQAKAEAFLTCTGGEVGDWEHVVACLRQVDPTHPLARTE